MRKLRSSGIPQSESTAKKNRRIHSPMISIAKAIKQASDVSGANPMIKAQVMLSCGDIEGAKKMFLEQLGNKPGESGAACRMIWLCSESGNIQLARFVFSEALSRCQQNPQLVNAMAQALSRNGMKNDEMRLVYEKEAEYAKKGDSDSAIMLLERLLERHPNQGIAMVKLITHYSKRKDIESAKRIFALARENSQDNILIFSSMMNCLLRNGIPHEAEILFNEAKARNLLDPKAFNVFLRYHLKIKDYGKAREIFMDASLKGLANTDTYALMLIICRNANEVDEALCIFGKALSEGKADNYCHSIILKMLLRDNRIEEAELVYGNAMHGGFADAHIKNLMLDAYARNGDIQKMEKIFESLCSDNTATVHSYTTCAKGYIKNRQMMDAHKIFCLASKMNMVDKGLFTLMIRAYGNEWKSYIHSERVYLKALQTKNTDSKLHASMIECYSNSGRVCGVREVLCNAVRLGEDDSEVYLRAICSLMRSGERKEATDIIRKACESGKLEISGILSIMNALYDKKDFEGVVAVASSLSASMLSDEKIALKLIDALRKQGKHETAISIASDILPLKGIGDHTRFQLKMIVAFCLKDSGKKGEAMKLFLELVGKYTNKDKGFLRLACGTVFCWEEQQFDRNVSRSLIISMYKELSCARNKTTNHSSGLDYDIEKALSAIEKSGWLESLDETEEFLDGRHP